MDTPKKQPKAKNTPDTPEDLSDNLAKLKSQKAELLEKVNSELNPNDLNDIYAQNKEKYEKEFGIKSPEELLDALNNIVA